MKKSAVIEHFGSQGATARALRITKGAVWQWKDIIPRGAAYQIEIITRGALRVDPAEYPPKKRPESSVAA